MKRFSLKMFAQGGVPFDLGELIPIFHGWIQSHRLKDLLIDVADYRHVPNGPSIMLIGHHLDYVFDRAGGLTYIRKQAWGEERLSAQFQTVAAELAQTAQFLTDEAAVNGLQFDPNQLEIKSLDRLIAPNHPHIFESLYDELKIFAAHWSGGKMVQIHSIENDPRKLLTIHLKA